MTLTVCRKPEPEDLFRLHVIEDARLSPDGTQVAYALKVTHLDRNEYTSSICVVSTGANGIPEIVRQVTPDTHRATSPRWSSDGRLAFVCDRSGKPQIYILDTLEDAPRQITHFGYGARSPVWSPDGERLVFVSQESPEAQVDYLDDDIRRITHLAYRFDNRGHVDGRFHHIWVVDARGGEPHRLTSGDQDDVMPTWSPDGREIAFVSNRLNEADPIFCSQLYVLPVLESMGAGNEPGVTNPPRLISQGLEMVSAPAWHPDGAWMACIGRRSRAPAGANNAVYIVSPVSGGDAVSLTEGLDRSPGTSVFADTWSTSTAPPDLFWGADAETVYFTACDRGAVSLFRTGTNGQIDLVAGGRRTLGFVSRSSVGNRIAYVAGDFTNPCDVYTSTASGSRERRLTRINDTALSEIRLQRAEPLSFPVSDGTSELTGWLVRPHDFKEGELHPLVQIIHGGPHSTFGHTFFFDAQLWAAEGWNVLFINPRGSQGHGEAFATHHVGNWGVGDMPEQEMALDLAIRQGGVNPDRLAVTGLSYGGYMTNWIIGHTSRYRAAISENGICNLVSFYGTSDIGWHWLERELRPGILEHMDYYMQLSPISYVDQVRTPTLLLQAEADWRCPIEQGEQFYTALRARGVPCEMVRFPKESHVFLRVGKPRSRLERRRHMLRWLQQHL